MFFDCRDIFSVKANVKSVINKWMDLENLGLVRILVCYAQFKQPSENVQVSFNYFLRFVRI
jgi:hypothetical protein